MHRNIVCTELIWQQFMTVCIGCEPQKLTLLPQPRTMIFSVPVKSLVSADLFSKWHIDVLSGTLTSAWSFTLELPLF